MTKVLEVSSSTNTVYKKYLSLTKSSGLKEHGLFLLSGADLTEEYLHFEKQKRPELICEIRHDKQTQISDASQLILTKVLFEDLDVLGTHQPILVVKQNEVQKFSMLAPEGLELVLPLGDPANLGACLRSAEAFGVQKIILTQEAAHPYLPKSVKASAGSVWRLRLYKGESLKTFGQFETGLSLKGKSLNGFQWPKQARLLLGEEGPGLPSLKLKESIKIETVGVESLNATVSASIALFHYRTQHKL